MATDINKPAQETGSQATGAHVSNSPRQMTVDVSKTHAAYANFCRVTGTPEELIIDFGLNAEPMGVSSEPINISERIVMNYFTAKRMMGALQLSLQRHEGAFGILETDVQKRVLPGLIRPASADR